MLLVQTVGMSSGKLYRSFRKGKRYLFLQMPKMLS